MPPLSPADVRSRGRMPRSWMPACRTLLPTAALVALLLPASAAAAITTTTIPDDSLAPGTSVAQYPSANPEIRFAAPSEYGFASGEPANHVVASEACRVAPSVEAVPATNSPPNALKMGACGGEFPVHGSFAVLTDSADEVSAYVGDPLGGGARFELDAYDVEGNLLKRETVITTEAAITTKISVNTAGKYAIGFFALYDTANGSDHEAIGMDDLSVRWGGATEPSISLASSLGSAQLAQGSQAQYQVSLVRHNESNGDVELSASGLPAEVHASFSPNPITGTGTSSTLTLSVEPGAPPASATGSIVATPKQAAAGKTARSVPISIQVVAPFGVYLGTGERVHQPSLDQVALPPCFSVGVPVVTLLGSGFAGTPVNLALATNGDTGDIGSISLPSKTLNNPSDFGFAGINEQTLTVTSNAVAEPFGFPLQIEITPSSGAFTEPTAKLEIAKVGPQINSVYPEQVNAPELHRPGSPVTIRGVGFCPGTKVTFGNSKATVTPTLINANGTEMTMTTPTLATSGPLTVESAGRTATTPPLRVYSYRDSSGFSWQNEDYGLHLSEQMTEELFGEEETHEEVFGVKWRKPNAGFYEDITNKHIPGGLCFGMAYTSLELRDYPSVLGELPSLFGGIYDAWHLIGPKGPSEPLLKLVVENFSLQFTDQLIPREVNAVVGIHGENDAINDLEAGLDEEQPVILGMIHWSGASIAGHTILAYDTRPEFGGSEVRVYNPNIPFTTNEEGNAEAHEEAELKNSQLHLDRGHWTFPQFPWEGSEADLVVYKHSELPIINREPPHLPNIFAAAGMVAFGDAGDGVTQLSDGHGSLFARGQLAPQSSWPKGVAPLPAFTSKPMALQLAALDPKQARTLTATIDRAAGGGGMDVRLPDLQANLQAGAHAGQVDHVTIDPRADSIGYATSASHTTLGGTLLSVPPSAAKAALPHGKGPSALQDRLVQFSMGSGSGRHDQLSFPDGRTFIVHHAGAPTTVSLTLQDFAGGQPTAVQLPPQRVRTGATLRVEPRGGWGKLGSGVVRVASTVHGHTTVRDVPAHRLGNRFASVRRAMLTALGRGRYRMDATLSLHHAPRQASLSVRASILQRGHTLIQAKPVLLQGVGLQAGKVTVTLPTTLRKGRYELQLRLLEIATSGVVQSSATITHTVTVTAH
jgi:IPT/TIG domain-containing protein